MNVSTLLSGREIGCPVMVVSASVNVALSPPAAFIPSLINAPQSVLTFYMILLNTVTSLLVYCVLSMALFDGLAGYSDVSGVYTQWQT